MKRNYLLLIYFALLLSGCSKYFYYVNDPNGSPHSFDDYKFIRVDSSYQLYIRKTYITLKNDYFALDNTQNPAPDGTAIGEIEYLLLSKTEKKAIYITTIRDKFKNYYSNRGLGDEYLNAYDFNKFFPGKWITGPEHPNSIGFVDDKRKIYWETSFNTDESLLFINCRMGYKISGNNEVFNDSIAIPALLKNPLVFRRVDNSFKIIFFDKSYCSQNNVQANLNNDKVYFKACNAAKNYYQIYFRFDRALPPSKKHYKNIMFKNKRLEFLPEPLFDN